MLHGSVNIIYYCDVIKDEMTSHAIARSEEWDQTLLNELVNSLLFFLTDAQPVQYPFYLSY